MTGIGGTKLPGTAFLLPVLIELGAAQDGARPTPKGERKGGAARQALLVLE